MSQTIDEKINTKREKTPLILQSINQMGILLVLSFIGMFIMIFFLFIFIRMMPGNPFMFGIGIPANDEMIEFWGLDKPIISQFFIFLWNLISGNWGNSSALRTGFPVKELMIEPYFKFLEINFVTLCFSLLLGVGFRFLIKKFKDKKSRKIAHVIKHLNWAIPVFCLGMLLQYTFGYKLDVLSSTGFYDPALPDVPAITHFRLIDCFIAGDFVALWDTILHLIMPVFCQSFIMFSFITDLAYSIIDFYKSPKETHCFSGKIAFYLGFIFTTNLLIEIIFSNIGMGNLITSSLLRFDILVLSASIYRMLLTFLIINIFINAILHIIRISKLGKISETENNLAATTISSDPFISESSSNSLETVSQPTLEENSFVLDRKTDNKESISKEIFRTLKIKISKPLTKKGFIFISIFLIIAIIAKLISLYDYNLVLGIDTSVQAYSAPTIEHIFGVTKFGRDVFIRCIFGIQTAVKVGIVSTLIGMPLGVLMGTISAFYGGWVKYIIDTINGIILVIPGLIFAYLILTLIGPNIGKFYWILGLVNMPIATLLTQQVISYEMKMGDIKPSNFNKTNGIKIQCRLPNIVSSILGVGCLLIGLTILLFESLNFLGVGDPMIASLGYDINIGQSRLTIAPWATFWPAFWIYTIVLSFMILGIGLKEE